MTAYVASLIRERKDNGESFRTIAKSWNDMSHPHIKAIHDGTGRVGAELEETIAALYFKGSVDDLRAFAKRWVDEHPDEEGRPAVEQKVEPLERYPARALAVAVSKQDGVDHRAIEWVEGGSHSLPADANFDDWRAAIRLKASELRRDDLALAADKASSARKRDADEKHISEMKKSGKPKLPRKTRPTTEK